MKVSEFIRESIVTAIDLEREYQRRTWGNGHDNGHDQTAFAGFIQGYAQRTRNNPDRAPEFYVKMAALAIAALDRHLRMGGEIPLRGRDYGE